MLDDRDAWADRFPEGWWGYHWAPPMPMSAVELIGTPAIDSRLMSTLWAVVSRRRSVMLSSEAPQAGKTTTLSALVDFLPEDTVGVFVRGWWERFEWVDEIDPGTGYLLINEMSDHLPIYVWGRAARGALMLAGKGWGLGATMHADSLPELSGQDLLAPVWHLFFGCKPMRGCGQLQHRNVGISKFADDGLATLYAPRRSNTSVCGFLVNSKML